MSHASRLVLFGLLALGVLQLASARSLSPRHQIASLTSAHVVAAASRSAAKLDCAACPDGWTLKSPGICQTTPAYKGPCGPFWDVSGYTQKSRDDFELLCYTKWPCWPHPESLDGVDLKHVDVPKPTSALDGVSLQDVKLPTKSPLQGVDLQDVKLPVADKNKQKKKKGGQNGDDDDDDESNSANGGKKKKDLKKKKDGQNDDESSSNGKSADKHGKNKKKKNGSGDDDDDDEEHISHHEHKRRRRLRRRRHHHQKGHGANGQADGNDDDSSSSNGSNGVNGGGRGRKGANADDEFDEFGNRIGANGKHGGSGRHTGRNGVAIEAPVLEPYVFMPPMDVSAVATAAAAPSPFKPAQPVCYKD